MIGKHPAHTTFDRTRGPLQGLADLPVDRPAFFLQERPAGHVADDVMSENVLPRALLVDEAMSDETIEALLKLERL